MRPGETCRDDVASCAHSERDALPLASYVFLFRPGAVRARLEVLKAELPEVNEFAEVYVATFPRTAGVLHDALPAGSQRSCNAWCRLCGLRRASDPDPIWWTG